MKKILTIIIALGMAISMSAQKKQERFDPKKFRAELEGFITKEACLTPLESSTFFPLYDEMNRKQRSIFDKMRNLGRQKPATEEDCRNAINERDKLELELKKIQQTYHGKFLKVLSAKKVFSVLQAEDRFHRRMLHRDGRDKK